MSQTQLLFGYKLRSMADAKLISAIQETLDQMDLQELRTAAKNIYRLGASTKKKEV